MMLTTLFRIGCHVFYTFPPTLLGPFSILSSFLVVDVFYVFRLMISWVCITMLTFLFDDLNQMSNFEKLMALNGDLITLNHWPKVQISDSDFCIKSIVKLKSRTEFLFISFFIFTSFLYQFLLFDYFNKTFL